MMEAEETTPIGTATMRYTVILEREPDGGFVASVPVLPGCVSQGDTREEALTNIKEAIDLYLEDCLAAGDPVPQEDSREFVELLR
jgi:predicted RNase H-like HicB family nuclease